jgi:hypothetical protein
MTAPSRADDLISQLANALAFQFAEALRGQLDAHLATLPAVRIEQVANQAAPPTLPPVLTVNEAAAHARRSERFVRNALHQYASSRGKHGLRGSQEGANCTWRIRRDDLDAWIDQLAPKRRRP